MSVIRRSGGHTQRQVHFVKFVLYYSLMSWKAAMMGVTSAAPDKEARCERGQGVCTKVQGVGPGIVESGNPVSRRRADKGGWSWVAFLGWSWACTL